MFSNNMYDRDCIYVQFPTTEDRDIALMAEPMIQFDKLKLVFSQVEHPRYNKNLKC